MIRVLALLAAALIAGCHEKPAPIKPILSDRLGAYNAQVTKACAESALAAWQANNKVDADLMFKLCIHEKGVRAI